jgi:hypothetical protein
LLAVVTPCHMSCSFPATSCYVALQDPVASPLISFTERAFSVAGGDYVIRLSDPKNIFYARHCPRTVVYLVRNAYHYSPGAPKDVQMACGCRKQLEASVNFIPTGRESLVGGQFFEPNSGYIQHFILAVKATFLTAFHTRPAPAKDGYRAPIDRVSESVARNVDMPISTTYHRLISRQSAKLSTWCRT